MFGPDLFATLEDGRLKSSVGTLYPRHQVLVTWPPMHALQREAFKDWFRATFPAEANDQKLSWEAAESVDLIFAPGGEVLIRPELERLDLAFSADRELQEDWGVALQHIRFLSVREPRVRQALRERGELWRISARPAGHEGMGEAVARSRVAIEEQAIYYYNPHTGTRFVTSADFAGLARLPDKELARQLEEIAAHCIKRNRHGYPEVAFFGVDCLRFGAPNFVAPNFRLMEPEALRVAHDALARRFFDATPAALREDGAHNREWLLHMASVISDEHLKDTPTAEVQAPGSEFAPRVRWLPGGAFQEGEFVFSQVLSGQDLEPADPELKDLWDPLARGFITNFIREHGNLEYLNLGRIEAPGGEDQRGGRRGVFLAEMKVRDEVSPRVLVLRVLRWGIRERLAEMDDEGRPKSLVQAIFDTEEYVDYTLDRRLGCLQFGMHLPARLNMRRATEVYRGDRPEFDGKRFPVIYFERDYCLGIPSNKIPERKLAEPRYALALARLLGKAAAPNLVVGRSRDAANGVDPGETLFDDGDEIVIESADGLPRDLILVDHSGAFADWRTPSLDPFVRRYALPVTSRYGLLPDPGAFGEEYLRAFREEFARIRADYLRRKTAFDGLFKHLPYHDAGSFACRWDRVLQRLAATKLDDLVRNIRRCITFLKDPPRGAD